MKSFSLKNKKITIFVAVVLIAAVILGVVFLPNAVKADIKNYNYRQKTNPVSHNDFDISLGNGMFGFDSKNSVFSVSAASDNVFFNSHSEEAAEYDNAVIASIRLRDKKGNAYSLDTSSNSVPFNTFKLENKKSNSFSVNYGLFPDEKQAEKGESGASVFAYIQIDFSEANGVFTASVNTQNIKLPKGFILEKLSILPGLFSVPAGEEAYFTVPDGCGAIINTAAVTEKPISLNLSVYGSDIAFNEYTDGAKLPFFAVEKDGYLLNSIIENGDALSEIICKKQKNGGGYLYNTFTVTPCTTADGKFIKGASYEGVLSQSYTLKKDGSYNDIALRIRDSLQKRGYLSDSLTGSTADLPFFINVIGSADGKNTLTSFESAAEITALLKSRGVRNISLRYSGYGKKGLKSDYKDINILCDSLGGKAGFNTLTSKLSEQQNTLHSDVNILSSYDKKDGDILLYDEYSKLVGRVPDKFSFNCEGDINSAVAKAYKFATGYPSTGICLNDGSLYLSSDLKNKVSRQQVLYDIQNSVGAFGAIGGFMLSEPAVYLMKQAQSVFSTPVTASCSNEVGVETVPILQMVIHGGVIYGSGLINVTSFSSDDAFLKCIEYGGVPSFVFTHSNETSVSYSSYATQTSKLYSRAKKLLPVMNMKITSHEKVTDGVYKITYDYSKIVYVNYNPSVVEINGVMISAKDFIVI